MNALIRRKSTALVAAVAAFAGLSFQASAQTPANSATLSRVIHDESGAPVESLVTVASNQVRQRALTAPDGTFIFTGLRTGVYAVCAQPTGRTAKPSDAPFVDACLWEDRSTVRVPLAPGQSRTGVVVPVVHGSLLSVRVNDPAGKLPAAVGKISGNALIVQITGPSGIAQHVPIVSQDATGRNLAIVIPFNTPHSLTVASSAFALTDQNGQNIAASAPKAVTVATGAPPQSIVVNVGSPIKPVTGIGTAP